jgi:hypothetical protein
MSSSGSQASAMAMSTRWRIPPENSCGYCRARRPASGMPASVISSTARSRAARPRARRCVTSVSAICRPTRATGLRLDIGSWGTNPIRRPRSLRSRRSSAPVMSSPSNSIEPPVTRPVPGSSPIAAAAVVDLPDPDSPTIATRCPRPTVRSTLCTTGRSSRSWA